MHVDVSGGHQRDGGQLADLAQLVQPHLVIEQTQQFDGQPAAAHEVRQHPARYLHELVVRRSARGRDDHQAVLQLPARDQLQRQNVGALGRRHPQLRDELAQVAVAFDRLREHDQRERRVGEPELAADDQGQLDALGSFVRADHARNRALVRDGQGRVAELLGALDELLGPAGTVQEGEGAHAAQLRVVGDRQSHGVHAKTPCRCQAGSSPVRRSMKIQRTPACSLSATQ